MLTKTQLKTAKTAELERLQRRIQKELEERRQEREEAPADKDTEQLFYPGSSGTYQWEYVQCGNKERCRKCKSGKKHGPYLYRYFYKDGKQKSQYIRLSELPQHPEAPARPV
jgi:hypothetical protein